MDTFGAGMSESEAREHIDGNDLLLVLYQYKKPLGFAGLKYDTVNDVAYLSGAVISRTSNGKDLYRELSRIRIRSAITNGYILVSTRTQNPKVEKGIIGVLEGFKREGIIDGYSLDRCLLEGVFGRQLTRDIPLSSSEDLNKEYSRLDYERGDAYYLSFKLIRPQRTYGCFW